MRTLANKAHPRFAQKFDDLPVDERLRLGPEIRGRSARTLAERDVSPPDNEKGTARSISLSASG